jgi:molybdate transport repressor ModE-like protein
MATTTEDFSPVGLRILREVAQVGSFSAAAQSLGYSQSAISRQVAALERVTGQRLFERGRHGVTLTAAGRRVLTSAARVLDELDAVKRELSHEPLGSKAVRLGAFPAAAAGLVPRALASLRREVRVTLREATTPALLRALRAETLDLAILALSPPFRAPDLDSPPLELITLSERELFVAVPTGHPLASARAVEARELEDQVWVASRSDASETLLGVWPGLHARPDVRFVVRDWLAKLQIVAAGLAITTVAPIMLGALPDGVAVLAVRGEPQETRRVVLAHRAEVLDHSMAAVANALIDGADEGRS